MTRSTADSYRKIKRHVAQIAKECGRDPEELTLVSVSKTFSWDQVAPAYEARCRDFGESRIQDALPKIEEAPQDIHWHFIGTLQKNKVRKAVSNFSLIHSVDSLELAEKIAACGNEIGVSPPVLLQVNTSGEKTKHGLTKRQWKNRLEQVFSLNNLMVAGLMTIAPFSHDPEVIRDCFTLLREFRDEINEELPRRKKLKHLSMGMTNDYPIAIEEGATILRIGSAIFGER